MSTLRVGSFRVTIAYFQARLDLFVEPGEIHLFKLRGFDEYVTGTYYMENKWLRGYRPV